LGIVRSKAMAPQWRELPSALALAAIPLGASLLVGMLLLPRQAMPDALPLPVADPHSLRQSLERDGDLAARARASPLPGVVRAVGSALRDFHALELTGAQPNELARARRAIDTSLINAQSEADGLLELRAIQLEAFLVEVGRFASTGAESPELGALAGGFVRTMRSEAWCEGHRLMLTEPQLRALFKQMWNALLGLSEKAPFALTLDEQRALFALRLSGSHVPAHLRDSLAAAKREAKDPRTCSSIEQSERQALEKWSLDHISRLEAIDPIYPAAYARGIARLRGGSYAQAANAFHEWLAQHPDGALALRARSYLRWASRASQVE
jgi:hypothetical protein